jgi:hypothetical protein
MAPSCLKSAGQVSIPAGDGVAEPRVLIDPDAFAWPAGGTEKFLGRDSALSPSSVPRQRQAWPDPVNLFGAATGGRAKSNRSGARRVRQVQHPGATEKSVQNVSAKGTYY